jgi:hypothetical protein
MNIYLKQANKLIEEENINDWRIKQAKALLAEVQKSSGLWDFIKNPMLSMVFNLLKPFVNTNYKIRQAVELLWEGLKEIGKA